MGGGARTSIRVPSLTHWSDWLFATSSGASRRLD